MWLIGSSCCHLTCKPHLRKFFFAPSCFWKMQTSSVLLMLKSFLGPAPPCHPFRYVAKYGMCSMLHFACWDEGAKGKEEEMTLPIVSCFRFIGGSNQVWLIKLLMCAGKWCNVLKCDRNSLSMNADCGYILMIYDLIFSNYARTHTSKDQVKLLFSLFYNSSLTLVVAWNPMEESGSCAVLETTPKSVFGTYADRHAAFAKIVLSKYKNSYILHAMAVRKTQTLVKLRQLIFQSW